MSYLGLLHLRVRWLTPPPHVLVQGENSDQVDQEPCTTTEELSSPADTQRPFRHHWKRPVGQFKSCASATQCTWVVRDQHLIWRTLCPVQQWNQETFAGAVVLWVDVTGQSAANWLIWSGEMENTLIYIYIYFKDWVTIQTSLKLNNILVFDQKCHLVALGSHCTHQICVGEGTGSCSATKGNATLIIDAIIQAGLPVLQRAPQRREVFYTLSTTFTGNGTIINTTYNGALVTWLVSWKYRFLLCYLRQNCRGGAWQVLAQGFSSSKLHPDGTLLQCHNRRSYNKNIKTEWKTLKKGEYLQNAILMYVKVKILERKPLICE